MKKVATFTGSVDLLAANFGGQALGANDDFFAECTALTNPEPALFIPGKFTDQGKWMDGWESRRKRGPGHDFCILRLGTPGRLHGFDIDTSHFNGNQPAFASIDATVAPKDASFEVLKQADWSPILAPCRMLPDAHNVFAALPHPIASHLRLNIFPDGGVARLRAYGVVEVNLHVRECDSEQAARVPSDAVDLAALRNGGVVLACSDAHFGSEQQLLLPGRSPNMGGGWETRRRRGDGHDWLILRLAAPGRVELAEIDTQHFKGNYPDRCALEGIFAPDMPITSLVNSNDWVPLMLESKLQADTRHFFPLVTSSVGPVSHLRLKIYPDGGVSRLRAWGKVSSG